MEDTSILIIDRDTSSARVLGDMLSARGFEVQTASGGAQALATVRSSPPSLILFSARLEDGDGFDLCRRLQQTRRSRQVPLIFISARKDIAGRKRALRLGAADVICKPFEMEEVSARIRAQVELLQLRRRKREISGRAAQSRRERDEWVSFAMQMGRMYAFEWNPAKDRVHRSHHPAVAAPRGALAALADNGRDWFRRIHRDDRSRLLKILSLLSPGYDTYDIRYRVARPDGEWIHLRESARAFFDSRGRLSRLVGMAGEITEQVENQAALERSEAGLLDLAKRLPIAAALIGGRRNFVYVNAGFERSFGYRVEELADSGAWFQRAFPEEEYGRTPSAFWRDTEDGDRGGSRLRRIICKDGSVRNVRIVGSAFGDGRLILFDRADGDSPQVPFDIEERFRTIADSAPVMLWITGPDKLCTFINRNWLEYTGRTMEQELGEGWSEGIHPDDLENCIMTYSRAFEARETFEMEYRLRRANGEYGWIIDRGSPYNGPDGSFAGYIGSAMDITEIKRHQEQLLAVQKLESLGILSSGIAHDFNNLLSCILAYADIIKVDLEAASPALDGIRKIETLAIRASEIVRQIMAFAGPDEGDREPIHIGRLVREMLDLLQISIPKEGRLQLDFESDLPLVLANAAQIRQIVMNLILNAAEALEERDGLITIRGGRLRLDQGDPTPNSHLPGGDYICLEVQDNGRGMSDEIRARIFDPFFSTKIQGRGLGLASVQKIVRNHGGGIEVISAPSKGTVFRILLPAGVGPSESQGSLKKETQTHAPGCGAVLVVEDEERLRLSVSRMLRKRGFAVLEAGDGNLAVELIRAHHQNIAVVLLDLTLPGKSSLEVFEELRRTRPDAKVILTSACGKENLDAWSSGTAPGKLIRKPYYISQLVSAVREALPHAEQCRH